MMYKFNKNIKCENSPECAENIKTKIENICGSLGEPGSKSCGHVSILHVQENHKIWIFLYDKGKHESESNEVVIMKDSNDITQYHPPFDHLPTLKEIKEAL